MNPPDKHVKQIGWEVMQVKQLKMLLQEKHRGLASFDKKIRKTEAFRKNPVWQSVQVGPSIHAAQFPNVHETHPFAALN